MEYTSIGKGNAALTTGIIGSAGFGLNLLGNLLGMNGQPCASSDDHFVNRYEAAQQTEISKLKTEIMLRDANTYAIGEVGKLRDYMERRFDRVEHELCDQRTYNAVNTSTISCIQGQIATLMGLTKTVIPHDSICPSPMPLYNSWVAPTAPTTAG
ncbi:MAG: hypothetical protein IIU73_00130 [Selenomonadales bacterium]|nr:hypothetical protein [Selenomonadales bacterium]